MQGRGRGNVAAERLCGALFVGLTALKGYFYTNLGGTLSSQSRAVVAAGDNPAVIRNATLTTRRREGGMGNAKK